MNVFSLLVEIFGDTKPLERDLQRAGSVAQKAGADAGDKFAKEFERQQERINGTVKSAFGVAGMSLVAAGAGLFSRAISEGAEAMGIRRQLTGVYQDSAKAQQALEALQDTAAATGYGSGVVNLGLKIAGRYNSVEELQAALGKQIDAAAAMGVTPQKFNEYQINIEQLQMRGNNKAEMEDVKQLLNAAPTAISRIAQAMNLSYADAQKKLYSMSGNDILKVLEKIGEQNKGGAAAAALSTLPGAADAVAKVFSQSLAPTGELLNRGLLPLATMTFYAAQGFNDINKATHGGAGLVVGMSLLAAGVFVTAKAYNVTFGTLVRFTAALEAATLALNGVSVTSGRAAAGSAIGGVGNALGGAGIGGLVARIAPIIGAAIPYIVGAALVAITGYGLYRFSKVMGGDVSDSGLQKFAKSGGFTSDPSRATEQKRHIEAVEQNTKALQDVRASMLGGGSRAKGMASILEGEFAMSQFLRGVA